MNWYGKRSPSASPRVSIQRGMTTDIFSWEQARDYSGGDYLLYNIYASDSWPVDTEDAHNLIATRHRGQSLHVPHNGHSLYYAVTATDRYGNESAPKSTNDRLQKPQRKIDFRQLIVGKSSKKTKRQTHFK